MNVDKVKETHFSKNTFKVFTPDSSLSFNMYVERIYNAPSGILSAILGQGTCSNYRSLNTESTSSSDVTNNSCIVRKSTVKSSVHYTKFFWNSMKYELINNGVVIATADSENPESFAALSKTINDELKPFSQTVKDLNVFGAN